jgi:hypothetical protein
MTAVETLRELWKDLVFAKVDRVITKPEDRMVSFSRRREYSWSHYYGFAMGDGEEIYFQRRDHCELDLDIDLTLYFSHWGNHHGGWTKPPRSALLGGEVSETQHGLRFYKWFVCPPPVKLLIDAVRCGTDKTEEELARVMMMPRFPDTVWAIARLVLFNNVEAFVDRARYSHDPEYDLPPHPAHGLPTGTVMEDGRRLVVEHKSMWLSQDVRKWIHVMSHRFDPSWWETFCALMKERDLPTDHLSFAFGDYCVACAAENVSQED